MASTFTSPLVDSNSVFTPFPGGTQGVLYTKHIVDAALVVNDIIQVIPVKAGQTVHKIVIKPSDLDSATSLVLDVGDGTTADYFIDGSTAGQTGVTDDTDANVAPKAYTVDDTIDILVQVAPGTGVAGSIEVWAYIS